MTTSCERVGSCLPIWPAPLHALPATVVPPRSPVDNGEAGCLPLTEPLRDGPYESGITVACSCNQSALSSDLASRA